MVLTKFYANHQATIRKRASEGGRESAGKPAAVR